MSKTEKAQTVHGDVEYDVVECSNCPNEFKKDETVPIYIDPYEKECKTLNCSIKYPIPRAERHLCKKCSKEIFDYDIRYSSKDTVHFALLFFLFKQDNLKESLTLHALLSSITITLVSIIVT